MNNKVALKELFAGLQAALVGELQLARTGINHPGDKGGQVEANWLAMLGSHLPSRYCIDKATVIDSTGACSDSIDIVIYDRQYSHLVFKRDAFCYVPAEAVYAAFEVKQNLSKENVVYAGKKAESVRRLLRTSVATVDVRGETPIKDPVPILAGILCTSSDWTPPFGDSFQEVLGSLTEGSVLDLGCIALAGAFQQDGKGLTTYQADSALAAFLFTLLQRLQQVGTVAPVDFGAYMRHMQE